MKTARLVSIRLLATVVACLALSLRPATAGVAEFSKAALASPAPVRIGTVENAYRLTDRVYSGGQPETDADFAALRDLGIHTLISVDGARPDAARAAQFGLRYIHLPQGYDGISSNLALRLVKAADVFSGPLFVHCHHGRHRGPAAAGLICQATAGWSTNDAVAWLRLAGTSPDYAGLFAANVKFQPPAPVDLAALSTNFTASARVSDLASAMVEVDQRWEHLRLLQSAGWRPPVAHPDLVPAQEATLLREAWQESARTSEARALGTAFADRLASAKGEAAKLEALFRDGASSLTPESLQRADELMKSLGQGCAACHRQHRN